MNKYTLVDDLYLYPTPAGAYHALSSSDDNKTRIFLKNLLHLKRTPLLSLANLSSLAESDDKDRTYELLHHCQKIGWVQGLKAPLSSPDGALEELLPVLLSKISDKGKVLLADHQGFYLACSGFTHEVAEELSALSAEISQLQMRRSGLLMSNMGLASHAWGVINGSGKSQVGFWPVFIGDHRFVITVLGTPYFNQAEFVSLAWALSVRYATKKLT
ncbi:MAG: hypothetical protein KAG06_00625 [Methylococcales bacterium]|nr:hypothetical protein [Methylococcales bacterium]